MEFSYTTDNSNNLTEQEKQYFMKLLMLQGQVDKPSIEKLNTCPILCIAYDNELPIGIGAIKQVYKKPFEKAEIPELKNLFNVELGYIYVLDKKKYRGKGIAKKICANLLEKLSSKNVFATTEENIKNPMKYILEKFGFKRAGKTYTGTKTKKTIGLYLLMQ